MERISSITAKAPRFGITTSNNVESINSRLRKLRELPVLELLTGIEKMVAQDREIRLRTAKKWTSFMTDYADIKKVFLKIAIHTQQAQVLLLL